MPPPAIKTVRQIIFYQYAKIITEASGIFKGDKSFYPMVMSRCNKLCSGELTWSSARREWQKEFDNPNICIYCGECGKLTTEHILPLSCGGEDIADNCVRVCASCNSSKGGKRLYEWRGLEAKDDHHRIAEGKYLKYLFSLHKNRGTLDISDIAKLCKACNLEERCKQESSAGKLSVFCIEGCFKK